MTLHCGPSYSVYKATTLLPSTLPSTLARDFNNANNNNKKEAIHERKSIQSLIDSSKKPPYARIDTILTNFFPKEYGEGFYGMEVGDVPGRPSFLQKVDLDAVDEKSSPVLQTNHPNLLNLLDISVCGDKLFFHYERPGISLERLHKSTMLDRVAVATICKKLLHGLIYIHEGLNVSHGHLHCGGIYLSDEGEIKIGGVGKSMTERGKAKDVPCDVQAVFQIASQLLSLDRNTDTTSMSWLIAKNFVTMPSTVDPRTLLKANPKALRKAYQYLLAVQVHTRARGLLELGVQEENINEPDYETDSEWDGKSYAGSEVPDSEFALDLSECSDENGRLGSPNYMNLDEEDRSGSPSHVDSDDEDRPGSLKYAESDEKTVLASVQRVPLYSGGTTSWGCPGGYVPNLDQWEAQ